MELFTKNCRYIDLQLIYDIRDGIINIAEASNQIPFDIKCVYSITRLKQNSDSRSHHAQWASKEIISLPINLWLKNKEADFII